MKMLIVLFAVSAVACGSPDFNGTWDGTLTQRAKCSDGSAPSREITMYLRATHNGDDLALSGNTSCGTITATVDGDTATLFPVECAPISAGTITYTDTIEGGTLTIRGSLLDVNAVMSTLLRAPNGATLLCSGPLTGTLYLRE